MDIVDVESLLKTNLFVDDEVQPDDSVCNAASRKYMQW